MKRSILLTIIVAPAFIVIVLMFCWIDGSFFLRSSNAKVSLNGMELNKAEVYESGNNEYLVFLNTENAVFNVYVIDGRVQRVGIPTSPVPSSYTKSLKTSSFVICLHCPVTLAGTDKLDSSAKVSLSPEQIVFKVEHDSVLIAFDGGK